MTLPIKVKGPARYTDSDEAARRRSRAIAKIGKAYSEGGAQSDNSFDDPSTTVNAAADYDMLRRVRMPARKSYEPAPISMGQVVQSYLMRKRSRR